MPVDSRGKLQFTGWREPISISGAGKAVSVILRRRPCFLCHRLWPNATWSVARKAAMARSALRSRRSDPDKSDVRRR